MREDQNPFQIRPFGKALAVRPNPEPYQVQFNDPFSDYIEIRALDCLMAGISLAH